jgi:predicted phosphoadenosine phosphosulfate sulfurtransferase
MKKVDQYIAQWKQKGYSIDIPDEVPSELMRLNLAPSYKAIACAILKNDLQFLTLGFESTPSVWYSALKKVEIEEREKSKPHRNLDLLF